LGIASKFIKTAVESSPEVFDCLKTIFPKLSDAKIKAGNQNFFLFIFIFLFQFIYIYINFLGLGVLTGPDIRKLVKSNEFTAVLTNDYRKAWEALKDVIQNVLGKHRADPDEAKKFVATMLENFENINVSMTLKLHFLHHHLDTFLQQLPAESDEQGERFHQVTMPMEKRFKGKKLDAMLAEVCWWSHKACQYDDEVGEGLEDPGHSGHTEKDMPLHPLSSSESSESDHDFEPEAKKIKH